MIARNNIEKLLNKMVDEWEEYISEFDTKYHPMLTRLKAYQREFDDLSKEVNRDKTELKDEFKKFLFVAGALELFLSKVKEDLPDLDHDRFYPALAQGFLVMLFEQRLAMKEAQNIQKH